MVKCFYETDCGQCCNKYLLNAHSILLLCKYCMVQNYLYTSRILKYRQNLLKYFLADKRQITSSDC